MSADVLLAAAAYERTRHDDLDALIRVARAELKFPLSSPNATGGDLRP